MIELLAVPAWKTPPRSLDDWVAQLRESAGPVAVKPDPPGASWIVVGSLGLRGYALIEGGGVEAIQFELDGPDPSAASQALEAAASALGWELHADDPDDEDLEDAAEDDD